MSFPRDWHENCDRFRQCCRWCSPWLHATRDLISYKTSSLTALIRVRASVAQERHVVLFAKTKTWQGFPYIATLIRCAYQSRRSCNTDEVNHVTTMFIIEFWSSERTLTSKFIERDNHTRIIRYECTKNNSFEFFGSNLRVDFNSEWQIIELARMQKNKTKKGGINKAMTQLRREKIN
jgi:hypothetical protein